MVDSSSPASWTDEDFKQTLEETGKKLLDPYDTVYELLIRLENLDHLLQFVGQDESADMEEALRPSKNALILDELLGNDNLDVKVSVMCCITEIARITAPIEPYGDDKMRDIFQVLLVIFRKLPSITGRSYSKAITIINNFSRCQLCLLMWDCDDALIVEMFQIFLHTIHSTARAKYPAPLITDMETIMTVIINDDEEDVPVELFSILLDTLKRENKIVSPLSYSMAERVFSNCAVKLKHRLSTTGRLTDINLDDYAEIVTRVCNDSEVVVLDDDYAPREVHPSLCAPSGSLVNNGAVSITDGDTLKNGASAETLQILEIKQQEVSVAETTSHCQNSDAIRALQCLEPNAVRSPKTNEESLKDETDLRVPKACDKIIANEACGSQTDDSEATKTQQEESNAEAVPLLKVNVDISAPLNACNQINQEKISDVPCCSQNEDPGTQKTMQEGSNAEEVPGLEVNVDTPRLKPHDQIKLQNSCDAKCSLSEDPDSRKMVPGAFNAEAVAALKINEENREGGNASTPLQYYEQIKLPNTSDTRTNSGPLNSDGATLEQRYSDSKVDSVSKKRGRKPNSLIKPEEGYDLSYIHGETKSPHIPRRRRNYRKEIGSPTISSVLKSTPTAEQTRDDQPQSASGTRRRSSLKDKKYPKKGKPRNKDNMVEADLLLLSDSARDLKRTSSVEKTSSYGVATELNLLGLKDLETESRKCNTHIASAITSGGISKNPERREGSSVQMIAKKQRSDGATKEQIRRKSPLTTLASCSTPNTSTQESKELNKAKRKRKHTTPLEERVSGLRQAVKDNGEKLVGERLQIFWPLDKKFYRGSVTSFDILTKKHKVTYDDGDEETLDLTIEQWELVEDENSSNKLQGQMTATDGAVLYNLSKNHIANSSQPPAKKQKASNIISSDHAPTSNGQKLKPVGSKSKIDLDSNLDSDPAPTSNGKKLKCVGSKSKLDLDPNIVNDPVPTSNGQKRKSAGSKSKMDLDSNIVSDPVPTSNGQKLKSVSSKFKLDLGKARDPATPAKSKMKLASPEPEDRTRSKSLQLMKGKKLLAGSIKASPRSSVQLNKKVNVHGYLVKPSRARILEAIVAKYGDIAANCLYKSQTVRASLLEVVCNVLQRLKSSNFTPSDIKAMMYEISDAADAKLEVSWLQQHLAEIIQEEQAAKRCSEVRTKTCLVMKAAEKDVKMRHAEFVAAKKQLRKSKRCFEVLKHVSQKIDDDIWESLAQEKSWRKRLNELL